MSATTSFLAFVSAVVRLFLHPYYNLCGHGRPRITITHLVPSICGVMAFRCYLDDIVCNEGLFALCAAKKRARVG